MASHPDEIRDRAWVDRRSPPADVGDGRMWIAEDPVTECAGVGEVELEAMGNLVSVVIEYEDAEGPSEPLLKAPGRVVARPSPLTESTSPSLFDRLRSWF